MNYFILLILNLLTSVICYITNPIVVLFANEVGDLPGFLKYWQTWDDSLDVDFMVKEKVPSIFRYDFDSKYISSREPLEDPSYGRDRGCVILREGATFSTKERIQRYFCRLLWLCRNNAYGFAFYVFGRMVKGTDIVILKNIHDEKEEYVLAYDKSSSIWTRSWILYLDYNLTSKLYLSVFLGWKIDYTNTTSTAKNAMMANRICIRIR